MYLSHNLLLGSFEFLKNNPYTVQKGENKTRRELLVTFCLSPEPLILTTSFPLCTEEGNKEKKEE